MKAIDFLKKNSIIIIILISIAFIIFIVCRENKIARISAELSKLKTIDESIRKDRDSLNAGFIRLQNENNKIQHEKDSIKAVQEKQKTFLAYIINIHKHQIDSLLNIPNDTVYVRLQPIYPRTAQEPLQYPFSGGQIRQIYTTALSYPRLQDEYSFQTTMLSTCHNLNKEYQNSEDNFKAQVANLKKNINDADQQIGIRDKELKITQKQLKARTFWSWVEKGAIIAVGAYAVIK